MTPERSHPDTGPGPVPGAGRGEEDEGGAPPPPPPPPQYLSPPPSASPSSLPASPPVPALGHKLPHPPASPRASERTLPPPPPTSPLPPARQIPPPLSASRSGDHTKVGCGAVFKALGLVRKNYRVPRTRILPESDGITLTAKVKSCEGEESKNDLESKFFQPRRPAGEVNERTHDVKSHEYKQRKNDLESELLQSRRTAVDVNKTTQDVSTTDADNGRYQVVSPICVPVITCTKISNATGSRTDWGKKFDLKFGNKTASKHIRSAEECQSKANEDRIQLVVSSIADLLSFDPETTIVEFDSDIEGEVLGRLFRIAKVLGFKYFVRNDTLGRAQVHYLCSFFDGERRGRNLDAEAKEVFRSDEDKEK